MYQFLVKWPGHSWQAKTHRSATSVVRLDGGIWLTSHLINAE